MKSQLKSWSNLHKVVIVVGLASIMGLLIGWRDRRLVLYDDVGITLRYAYRLAEGHGWTYNDNDQTNGASSPLYTMILAICRVVGLDLVQSARMIGVILYAGVVGAASYIAQKIAGVTAGLVAAVLVLTSSGFRAEALSGMETILSVFLGILVILAIMKERDWVAAVLLGLALVNKLDAGLLVVVVVFAWWFLRRAFPWKQIVITVGLIAPWFLFSWIYFGSPLPYSMTQKISGENGGGLPSWNTWWMFERLQREGSLPLVFFALVSILLFPFISKSSRSYAASIMVCLTWPLLHFVAFSFVDMGDPYPWYMGSLYVPLAVAASVAIVKICSGSRLISETFRVVGILTMLFVVSGLGLARWGGVGQVINVVRNGHTVDSYEAFELTRYQSGEWLAQNASADEGILTCWGWVAYMAEQSPIAETCPLSTRDAVVSTWFVNSAFIGTGEPQLEALAGWVEVVSFRSDGGLTVVYRSESPQG